MQPVRRRREIPRAYDLLQASTHHVEGRASTGLYNFLTANSVLVLSWSALFAVGKEKPWVVMLGISIVGVLSGFQWALLGTRTWHYALEYGDQLRWMWWHYGLSGHIATDTAVYDHWGKKQRFLFSANHWVLFLAPLALSFLHMVMLTAVLWPSAVTDWVSTSRVTLVVIAWVAYVVWLDAIWSHCEPVLRRQRKPA